MIDLIDNHKKARLIDLPFSFFGRSSTLSWLARPVGQQQVSASSWVQWHLGYADVQTFADVVCRRPSGLAS